MASHAKATPPSFYIRVAAVCLAVLVAVIALAVFLWPERPSDPQGPSSVGGAAGTTGTTSVTTTTTTVTDPTTTSTEQSTTAPTTVTTTTTTTKKPTATTGTTTTKKPTTVTTTTTTKPNDPPIDAPANEMRGTWVSYIELNGLLKDKSEKDAKKVIDGIMDNCVAYGLNTVFWHARANSDAYYRSDIFNEDASVKALVEGGFDPLEYAVQQAHARGLELHAWVNPYRVGRNAANLVEGIPFFVDDTDTYPIYYYVPSSEKAQQLIVDGVKELLAYGVDGVHFDDYFYPAAAVITQTATAFEKADYDAYKGAGGTKSVQDWRRMHVSALVKQVYETAHEKGKIFGIAPSSKVSNAREKQYADLAMWLSNAGYVDYLCPQIYYGFEHGSRPFDLVFDEWNSLERHSSVRLYVGLAVYKVGIYPDPYAGTSGGDWADDEDVLYDQLRMCRQKGWDGVILYSYTYLDPNAYRKTETVSFNGSSVEQTYNKTMAAAALRKLLEELKNG